MSYSRQVAILIGKVRRNGRGKKGRGLCGAPGFPPKGKDLVKRKFEERG